MVGVDQRSDCTFCAAWSWSTLSTKDSHTINRRKRLNKENSIPLLILSSANASNLERAEFYPSRKEWILRLVKATQRPFEDKVDRDLIARFDPSNPDLHCLIRTYSFEKKNWNSKIWIVTTNVNILFHSFSRPRVKRTTHHQTTAVQLSGHVG